MAELRELKVSKAMAPPYSLVHLPKLESLTYNGEYEDGLELAQVIEDNKLPSLRNLSISFEVPIGKNVVTAPSQSKKDPPDEMYAKVYLELLSVCGQKHVAMISPWKVEELESYVLRCNSNPLT